MQSSNPAQPEQWATAGFGLRDYLAVAGLLAAATTSALAGLVVALAGNVDAAKYLFSFALVMALVTAFGAAVRCHGVRLSNAVRTVEGTGGIQTEIRYSNRQFAILVAMTACCTIFCFGAAVEIFVHREPGNFPGAAVALGALGCFFASFVVAAALGRIRRGGVILSERGIGHRGWSFESRLEWPAVAGIKPAFNGYPVILVIGYSNATWRHRYTTRMWRIDRLPPVPMIEVDCRRFDVDPSALYEFLRTYVDEPIARRELGTDAALMRAAR